MIIIAFYYIIDYALNDKFEIEYLKIENQTELKDVPSIDNNPDYNPTLKFKLSIFEPLSDKFKVHYQKDNKEIITNFENCTSSNQETKCFL